MTTFESFLASKRVKNPVFHRHIHKSLINKSSKKKKTA